MNTNKIQFTVVGGHWWQIYSYASGDNVLRFKNDSYGVVSSISWDTGVYNTLSDQKYKKNINELKTKTSYNVVKNLKIKKYAMIHEDVKNNETTNIGVIAQDMVNIRSECVKKLDDDKFGVNYNDIFLHTTNVVQDLIKRVEILECMPNDNPKLVRQNAVNMNDEKDKLEQRLVSLEEQVESLVKEMKKIRKLLKA